MTVTLVLGRITSIVWTSLWNNSYIMTISFAVSAKSDNGTSIYRHSAHHHLRPQRSKGWLYPVTGRICRLIMNSAYLQHHQLRRQTHRLSLPLPPIPQLLPLLPHQQPSILKLRHRRLLLGYHKISSPLHSIAQERLQVRELQHLFRV